MTSSMLSGERRWATSSRRGGMTVLGKVAVPKPINLPSQRLENHGLDPNVEIVPKGTLSWGSRSSSSTSNAWGSSLSPNTDGGTSSPSHLSARPSSGGSGTRPSTAGSDRALDSTTNAWGSNSRPSSASGALPTNQCSLTSLRPRSAETRPGSSQLSRFAEPLADNSGAWVAARTAEKLGVTQPKNDGFSLSSGDFPSLSSDKDKSAPNSELQDHISHTRPGSSPGPRKEINETSVGDDVPVNANNKAETVDYWRDHQPYNGDGMRPSVEKWQGNSKPYPNTGFPPQHYDAWHGPPVNNPQDCVWFRGPPSGPPFGNPAVPSGFPIEQFPYYRPHIPSTGLANPPPVPPPGTGPRGHHKNGDVYRPQMPDAYIRPGIPIRPGFYPGSMAYEGYYGPPMGYCNSNERDAPFMGMASGPVYNRYPNQNHPEPRNSAGQSSGHSNAGKQLTSEQVEPRHIADTSGPFRVLLKQHESDGKNETTNWEDSESTDASYVHGRDQPRMAVWENEQRSNYQKHVMDLKTSVPGEKVSCQPSENQVSSSSVIGKPKFQDSSRNIKKSDDISSRKLDVTTASEMPEFSPKQSAQKDASLIQKIEGLNAKARDTSSARIREERGSQFHAGNAPVNRVETEVDDVVFPTRTLATEGINPVHREVGASAAEKNSEYPSFSRTDTSRQTTHGMQGGGDHRNKGRLNNQDADGWQKKSVIEESSASTGAQLETSNVLVGEHCISVNLVRLDGEAVQTKSVDSYAQRAKFKELAKQRTKQLQEEEEERTRKQRAKALAKLDELNRRSQSVEGSTEKEYATGSSIQNKPEESQPSESVAAAGKLGVVSSTLYGNANAVCQINDTGTSNVEKPPILSSEPALDMHKNSGKEPLLNHIQSRTVQHDVNSADATNALHVYNNITTKQKRTGYKKKQNPPFDKTSNVPTTSLAPKTVQDDIAVDVSLSSDIVTNEVDSAHGSGLPMSSSAAVESSVHPKKKNHRNGKNKNKVEESLSPATLPLAVPKEANLPKNPVESDKSKASDSELDQGSLQPALLSKDPNQFFEQHKHVANEESHVRTNSQWKSQHNRRTPRNMQGNRQAEKSHGSDAVMWAPVKSQNKTEVMDESNEKSKIEAVNPVKCDQQEHNLKNKRAELERYVPKPVAKEMAHKGTTQQQATSFISQAHTDDGVGRDDYGLQNPLIAHQTNSAVGRVGSGMESKSRNGRHKQGKGHGSWQQRNVMDSSHVHDMKNGLDHDSNSGPNVQRPTEHHNDQKSELPFRRGQTKRFGDCSDRDGSNNPGNHDSVELVSGPVTKDHSTMGRGRRGPSRGHRGVVGVHHDVHHQKNAEEREQIETHVSFSEHGKPDVGAAFKENWVVGERLTSQWQPKSQASNNPRGTRPNDQNVSSAVVGTNKKDSTHDDESLLGDHGKSSDAQVTQLHHDQLVSEKSKAGEAPNFGNQEAKREKRNAPTKRRPRSPNQASVSSVEQAPAGADLLHEQHPLSGLGKNGNQNRHGRGHESHKDWKSSIQDNRRHNESTNQERQGSNLQYEYHPVEPYDSKLENFERPKVGNSGGGKFRERGQTHSRRGRGNSHGRQGCVD